MRTNDLREAVKVLMSTLPDGIKTYYQQADEDAMYPHCVFQFGTINDGDLSRHDYRVDIDVWDRDSSSERIEDLCDMIEDLFDNTNDPRDTILPTFFLENRILAIDEDKRIKHRIIRLIAQNYERGV